MGYIPLLVLFLLSFQGVLGRRAIDPVHDPSLWDSLLVKYVREGAEIDGINLNVVNYSGIAQDADFGEWLSALETAKIDNLTRDETYAFYTNVYNSLAIDMMVKHACKQDVFGKCGAISGIRDIGTIVPFVEVWNQPAGTVGGKVWSLQQVEDYLLAPPNMKPDPRVHSAIVCASVSCPNVRRGAYRYEFIDLQYNQSWNNFMFNAKKGMLVGTSNKQITLSKIFNWYEGMFEAYFSDGKGTVMRFVMTYLWANYTDYQWLMKNANVSSVGYFDYDWNANVDGKMPCGVASRPCYPLWALLVTVVAVLLVIIIVAIVIVCVRRRRRGHAYHRVHVP